MSDNNVEKIFFNKRELIKFLVENNENEKYQCSYDTVKSFIDRKFVFSMYKNEEGIYRIPINVVNVIDIIFKHISNENWSEFRKPIIKGKGEFNDKILAQYEEMLEIFELDNLNEPERITIEYLLDIYTRKTQIGYLNQIDSIKELITYESNELSYDSTLNIFEHMRNMCADLLLCIIAYKDKHPDMVYKEVHKNYELPIERKEIKKGILNDLENFKKTSPLAYNDYSKIVEEILK